MNTLLEVIISAVIGGVVGAVTTFLLWSVDTRRKVRQIEEEWKRERERTELQFWLERGRRERYKDE